jgi:hypothetical protein
MPGTPIRLFGPALLTAAAATKFTGPAGITTRVLHMHFNNEDTSARTVTVSVGADAVGTELFTTFSIAATSVYDYYPVLVIAAAEIIQAFADVTLKVNLTIEGEEWVTG